jgi:hypothetical protein
MKLSLTPLFLKAKINLKHKCLRKAIMFKALNLTLIDQAASHGEKNFGFVNQKKSQFPLPITRCVK